MANHYANDVQRRPCELCLLQQGSYLQKSIQQFIVHNEGNCFLGELE
jgi:hypothetical protein